MSDPIHDAPRSEVDGAPMTPAAEPTGPVRSFRVALLLALAAVAMAAIGAGLVLVAEPASIGDQMPVNP